MSLTLPARVAVQDAARSRRTEDRLFLAVWCALCLNAMPYHSLPVVVPLPGPVGQLVAQAALPLAAVLALLLNRRLVVRPSLPMLLITLFALLGVVMSLHSLFVVGSVFRGLRYLLYVVVLWLLTPYWGQPDRPFLRAHTKVLVVVVAMVPIGLLLSPGAALAYGGRLSGTIWPIPPTQVAHYAAVLVGVACLGWLMRERSAAQALVLVTLGGAVLLGTHTRTAILALVVGLAAAVISLFLGNARVRHTVLVASAATVGLCVVFAATVRSWLLRGQTVEEASALTGRTAFWEDIVGTGRTPVRTLLGDGPSDGSFNGLPIDSNWLATYVDAGLLGVGLQVALVLTLLGTAIVRQRGAARAYALFLVGYFVVAGFTENALNSPSLYLLELVVAASLLARPARPLPTPSPPPQTPVLAPAAGRP